MRRLSGTALLVFALSTVGFSDGWAREQVACGTPAQPCSATEAGDRLFRSPVVGRLTDAFYARRRAPAWQAPPARDAAAMFINAVDQAAQHGLDRAQYPSRAQLAAWLDGVSQAGRADDRAVPADALLTRSFLTYAVGVSQGVSALDDPARSERTIDVAAIVARAVDGATAAAAIRQLPPVHPEYARLQAALAEYRERASRGTPEVTVPDMLLRLPTASADGHSGSTTGGSDADGSDAGRAAALGALRARLVESGELEAADVGDGPFDERLDAAVRRFQQRHGLAVDGVVGPRTRAALHITAADRARQIAVNMDRWRQLPDDLGDKHIRVNIPAFSASLFEHGDVTFSTRVIVGLRRLPTPVFNRTMTYLEFRPYWNIPRSIAVNEIMPKVARDPEYLAKERIEVLDGWGAAATPVDPDTVDWSRRALPYRLRQAPGPHNALGLVKFMFPNEYNVYLHDTPNRRLFDRPARALSHGCVRVEHPDTLATLLLRQQGWTAEQVQQAMRTGGRQVVPLRSGVPVYLLYLTAWVEDDGAVRFAPDIYDRDGLNLVN